MINLEKIFADTLAKYPKAAGTLAYNTAVRSIGIRNEGIEHRIEVFGLDNIADEYVTYRKDCIKALNKMKRQRSANKINIFKILIFIPLISKINFLISKGIINLPMLTFIAISQIDTLLT